MQAAILFKSFRQSDSQLYWNVHFLSASLFEKESTTLSQ